MRAGDPTGTERRKGAGRPALAAVLTLAVVAVTAHRVGPAEGSERVSVRVGLPSSNAAFLSLYLAAERTAPAEQLDLELTTLRAGAGLAPALASGSVDVGVASLNTVTKLVGAGEDVKVFYGGLSYADAAWFSRPPVRTWEDLRGRTVAIPTFGGYVHLLAQRALRKRGLTLGQDVHVARMGSDTTLQALVAGRIDAALLSLPFSWEAQTRGLARLGNETEVLGTVWPKNLFFAKTRFLESQPAGIRALLRAHVRALRLAKADPALAADTLVRRVGYSPAAAEHAVREVVGKLSERGEVPADSLRMFWEVMVETGEEPAAWPEARYLDRRLIDSFETWAPP
jgi:NitT/TauT family transport system substrate-binding protein